MNSDFRDLLQAFEDQGVKYLVVGGYAAIHYSQPRYTKDIDLWVEPSLENAKKVLQAFYDFGLPVEGFDVQDLAQEGFQFFVGCPPCAFDFLTSVPGLNFEASWHRRTGSQEDDLTIWYLSKEDLIISKKVANRDQDLKDIDEIRRADS